MLKKLLFSFFVVAGASVVSFAAADYCTPNFTYGTADGDYVARVLLTGDDGSIDNTTAGAGVSPAYTYYSAVTGVTLSAGS